MKDDSFVTVMHFENAPEANIYRSPLESNGIRAYLTGETFQNVFPVTGVTGGLELQVSSEDAQRAKEILQARFSEREFRKEVEESEEAREKAGCPEP